MGDAFHALTGTDPSTEPRGQSTDHSIPNQQGVCPVSLSLSRQQLQYMLCPDKGLSDKDMGMGCWKHGVTQRKTVYVGLQGGSAGRPRRWAGRGKPFMAQAGARNVNCDILDMLEILTVGKTGGC